DSKEGQTFRARLGLSSQSCQFSSSNSRLEQSAFVEFPGELVPRIRQYSWRSDRPGRTGRIFPTAVSVGSSQSTPPEAGPGAWRRNERLGGLPRRVCLDRLALVFLALVGSMGREPGPSRVRVLFL